METGQYDEVCALLPRVLAEAAAERKREWAACAEEFRLRSGREATVVLPEGERPVLRGRTVTTRELEEVLERATRASLHAHSESLRRGYVTTACGCRVGVCGTAAVGRDGILNLRMVSSLCLRIPRQCRGCAEALFPALAEGGYRSTLLLSPPGGGKTTLLRELVRLFSESGTRVSVADARGEIAACSEGVPRFDIGPCTDVMSGGTKAESALMLLRSMNPELLALDEITSPEDLEACRRVANCGVGLLATAHASDEKDLFARALYRPLTETGIFPRCVVIRRENGRRHTEIHAL